MNYMPNPSYRWLTLYIFLVSFSGLLSPSFALEPWKKIAPGIHYLDLAPSALNPWSHLHAFKINLKKNQIKLAMATSLDKQHASVERLASQEQALIAINGGFFDKQYHPLGLRISNGKRLNPLKYISWWGILYLRNNQAFLSSPSQFKNNSDINFAVQSGPRLIIDGRIPTLKTGSAQRTALGIDKSGSTLFIVVSENKSFTTTELASQMIAPPLNCYNALNLDGGSSTQLLVNSAALHLNIHGFSNVSDAVLVTAR